MLYTRQAVQENIRNRDGKRVFYLGKGHQLTSDARDWLSRERIPILPGEQARPQVYKLLGGGTIAEKPEHMTHLHGDVLVEKTHPRIRFRGTMDSLQAELLLAICQASGTARSQLEQVLELSRQILSREVMNEPVQVQEVAGLSAEEIRSRSHRPQDYYGQPHFMPSGEDGPVLLQVNRARTAARQAELAAVDAFLGEEGLTRPDLVQALNRLSSMLYLIMIQLKKEMRN